MKSVNPQTVNIPITQVSRNKKTAKGKLYGSGDTAIIFSNMDTNNQNERTPAIDDIISDRYMILTYDYPLHMNDQSETLEDAISFVSNLGAKKSIRIGAK